MDINRSGSMIIGYEDFLDNLCHSMIFNDSGTSGPGRRMVSVTPTKTSVSSLSPVSVDYIYI